MSSIFGPLGLGDKAVQSAADGVLGFSPPDDFSPRT